MDGKEDISSETMGGCDIDYEWQIPQVEFWLRKHGFTENSTTEGADE